MLSGRQTSCKIKMYNYKSLDHACLCREYNKNNFIKQNYRQFYGSPWPDVAPPGVATANDEVCKYNIIDQSSKYELTSWSLWNSELLSKNIITQICETHLL